MFGVRVSARAKVILMFSAREIFRWSQIARFVDRETSLSVNGMTANWTSAHFDKSWLRIWSLKDAGLSTAYLCDLLEGGS